MLWHRDRLDEAQRMLREIEGVTVLIYDQHCAADARRKRKRGTLPARTHPRRHQRGGLRGLRRLRREVATASRCSPSTPSSAARRASTRPSCNTDYSCLDGDCPSFVTVELAPGEKRSARPRRPDPARRRRSRLRTGSTSTQNVFLAGIGGTGIVTVNQVLATAALRAGLHVECARPDRAEPEGGPGHLASAVQLRARSSRPTGSRPGSADCVLGFDLLTAADDREPRLRQRRAARSPSPRPAETPTGDDGLRQGCSLPRGRRHCSTGSTRRPAACIASTRSPPRERLFGNTAAANFLLVGAAYQAGATASPAAAIEEAIGINGVAVDANIAAFRWGRAAVADPAAFRGRRPRRRKSVRERRRRTGSHVRRNHLHRRDPATGRALRAAQLVDFQAVKIAAALHRSSSRQSGLPNGPRPSGPTSARRSPRDLFKFTAYKDEYEVARMLTDPAFIETSSRQVPAGENLTYKLHPPIAAGDGPQEEDRPRPRSRMLH